jgi:hypothetical protein
MLSQVPFSQEREHNGASEDQVNSRGSLFAVTVGYYGACAYFMLFAYVFGLAFYSQCVRNKIKRVK